MVVAIDMYFSLLFHPAKYLRYPHRKVQRRHKTRSLRWKLRPLTAASIISMSSTTRFHHTVRVDSDSESIGIDNRATACISHKIDDFVGELYDTNRVILGYNGSRTTNIKTGTLRWNWTDDNGINHTHVIPNSFYSPTGGVRLLSPQHWAQSIQRNLDSPHPPTCVTTSRHVTLQWGNGKYIKTIPLGLRDNVATLYSSPGYDRFHAFCAEAGLDSNNNDEPLTCDECSSILEDDLDNGDNYDAAAFPLQIYNPRYDNHFHNEVDDGITSCIKIQDKVENNSLQLLHYHHKYGHIPFARLKQMAKQGIIPSHLQHAKIPACAACLFGRATRRPWRHKTPSNRRTPKPITSPGQQVSVDMLTSPTPGFVAQMTGLLTKQRYRYATVFVDHYSGYGYLYLQKTQTVEETLEAKTAFEQHALQHGVKPTSYHADNGVFRANKWVQDCIRKHQTLTFAGVNAHHQNGRAERRIGLLQELTRTQLIHLAHQWKQIDAVHLWPYAMRLANLNLNNTPNLQHQSKLTALQLFTNSTVNANPNHQFPFGAPVYVLNQALQQQQPFHKWKQRAKLGLYLGPSPNHARNISLVLDLHTGLVSPQFHVAHDPTFLTVKNDATQYQWSIKAGMSTPPSQTSPKKRTQTPEDRRPKRSKPSTDNKSLSNTSQKLDKTNVDDAEKRTQPSTAYTDRNQTPIPNTVTRRSTRTRKSPQRLTPAMESVITHNPEGAINPPLSREDHNDANGEIFALSSLFPDETDVDSDLALLALKAATDPDTLYFHEAIRQPDRAHFIEAMEKEISDNNQNDNFQLVHRSTIPTGCTVLPSVWQLRRKRHLDTGKIKKYKARINVDGSRMIKHKHYDQTYSPVASWAIIRLLMTIAAVHRWPTKQLDYVLAFPQAPIERELYMSIPKGYQVPEGDNKNYALKLNKNLYGQKQAGRVWNQFLVQKLESIGFHQSKYDPCILYRGNVIYILYTDDSIITAPTLDEINEAITAIKSTSLKVTEEGDVQDFLGVNITRKDDTIEFKQTLLIQSILGDLRLNEHTRGVTRDIPAQSSTILKRHATSEHHDNSFNYRSIIGKLGYLEKGSRPDIAYIVHQCARFSTSPRVQHTRAIRWLGRYLKATKHHGMILRPDKSKGLELFVDADFAGNWDPVDTKNPDTARSRHGYVIKYANCPIIWKSQLQREIALSSTESEYTGLSYAIREVIPIMNILQEISHIQTHTDHRAKLYLKVFEDNAGAIEMATTHKYRPRTKHLNIRLHHFRQYVSSGTVQIEKIHTDEQLADIFTKPLASPQFQKLRQKILGW